MSESAKQRHAPLRVRVTKLTARKNTPPLCSYLCRTLSPFLFAFCSKIDVKFLTDFGGAFQNFFKGEWDKALDVFRVLAREKGDGVSLYYVNIVERGREKRGDKDTLQCPKDFHGFNIEGHEW